MSTTRLNATLDQQPPSEPHKPTGIEKQKTVEEIDEAPEPMQWLEILEIAASTITPILLICIAAALLYKKVDESRQSYLANITVIPHLAINGSGSAIVSSVIWGWMYLFKESFTIEDHIIDFSYAPSTSTKGAEELFSGLSLFAGTEANISESEFINARNAFDGIDAGSPQHYGALTLPIVAGALAVVYNIPGFTVNSPALIFDAKLLSDIFSGQITYWNDTRIQSLNPSVQLPYHQITPIVLNDPSDILPKYLSKYNPFFTSTGPQSWPQNFIKGTTTFDILFMSGVSFYSITYTPLQGIAESTQNGRNPTVARIINSHGDVTTPTTSTIQNALAALNTSSTTSFIANDFTSITDLSAPDAYPLSFISHILVRQHYFYFTPGSTEDCLRVKWMVHLWYFFMTDEFARQSLDPNGWVFVTPDLVARNMAAMKEITCNRLNVMDQLISDFSEDEFLKNVDHEWDISISFWYNLNSFTTGTKVGMSLYASFYILLILSNAIPFTINMYSLDPEAERKHSRKSTTADVKVKWTLQNWLGIVTQLFTCFQIMYLCLHRSKVILDNVYVDIVSYIGLIFDWFGYYIIINVMVAVWLVCMVYTTYFYGILEFYYPERLQRLTKFHMFLANFMPNFSLIFYNPSVELLAKVFDCRLSPTTFKYSNSYHVTCWQGYHWVMVILSISFGCAFCNCVVRYCKILKLLRKDFNFKDRDWNIYLESISKTVVIILFFNTPNIYFLPCAAIITLCLSSCSFFGKPNHVEWFDRIRGCLYAYCTVVCVVLFIFEVMILETSYTARLHISAVLSPTILGSTIFVCFVAHSYAMMKFRSAITESDRKKQDEELKKFFAAFGEEIVSASNLNLSAIVEESDGPQDQMRSHLQKISSIKISSAQKIPLLGLPSQETSRIVTTDSLLPPTGSHILGRNDSKRRLSHLLPEPYIPQIFESNSGSAEMIHLNDAGHINNGNEIITPGFTTAQWQKMEEFLTKANEIGLLEENEFEAVKQAIQNEDVIIPALFNRSHKNLRTFTNLLKKKVWELLNEEGPKHVKSIKTTTTRSSETDPLYQARESQGSRRASAFNQRRRTSKLSTRTRPVTGTDFNGFNVADEAQNGAAENISATPHPRSRTNSFRPVSTMAGSRIEIHDPSSNQPLDPKPRLGSRPTSLFLGSKQDIHGSQAHMDPKSKPTSRPASLFISSRPTSLFLDKRSAKGSVDQVSSSVTHSQRLAPSPQGSAMNSMRPSIVTSRSMEYPQHCPELDAAIAAIPESAENSRAGSRASTRPSSAIFPSHMIRIEAPTPRESTYGERKPEESGTMKAAPVLSSVAESSTMPSEDNLPLSQLQSQTSSQMTEKSVGVELKPLELKPASTLSMPNVMSIVEPSTLSSTSETSLKKASSVQDNTATVQIVVPVGVRKSSSFSGSQKLKALDIIAEDSEGTPQIPQTRSFEAPPSQKQPKKDITKSEGSLSVTTFAPPPKLRGKPAVPAVVVPPPKEDRPKVFEPVETSKEAINATAPIPMIVMDHPSETEIVVDLSANSTTIAPEQQTTEESSGKLVPKPPSSLSPISPVSPKPRFKRASNISENSSPTSPNPVHPDIPRPANKE